MSREERKPVKFTNVKYYRGGSKTPLRLRFNQNRTFYLRNPEDYTDNQLLNEKILHRVRNLEKSKKISHQKCK